MPYVNFRKSITHHDQGDLADESMNYCTLESYSGAWSFYTHGSAFRLLHQAHEAQSEFESESDRHDLRRLQVRTYHAVAALRKLVWLFSDVIYCRERTRLQLHNTVR
jgi:hypothetical protein